MSLHRWIGCLVCAVSGIAGCAIAGDGEGWVVGRIYADDCRNGDPLDTVGATDDFDLGADFFVGDPLLDSSDRQLVNRSSLVIRIQQTSNRIEQSDSLLLQIHDTEAAARAFARGEPVGADDCFELGGCPSGDVVTRAQLNLYNRCPGNKAALVASNRELVAEPSAAGCYRRSSLPTSGPARVCPELSEEDRQRLLQICEAEDFNAREPLGDIERILGRGNVFSPDRVKGNACLFLCKLGDAARGEADDTLGNFEVDYGEEVAGIFAYNLVDPRALTIDTCASARGQIFGMFRFEIVRSRSAQAFP